MTTQTSTRAAYLVTFGFLMVLLIATVAAASIHLGPWALLIALVIATIKIVLIAVVFMHLRDEPPLVRIFATAGLFWLGILFLLMGCDYFTRILIS